MPDRRWMTGLRVSGQASVYAHPMGGWGALARLMAWLGLPATTDRTAHSWAGPARSWVARARAALVACRLLL